MDIQPRDWLRLSSGQQKQLIEKLKEAWQGFSCEICHTENWEVSDRLHAHSVYLIRGGGTSDGPGMIPLALVTCEKCGNVKMVNAIAIGLIDPKTGGWIDG